MEKEDGDIIDLLKRFEVVNKDVIALSRRLSEMKAECVALKQKIKFSHTA